MKRLILLILVLTLILPMVLAQNESCVTYFYGEGCEQCSEVTQLIKNLQIKYPTISIDQREVYLHPENEALLNEYFNQYRVDEDSQGLPAIFIGDVYFIGNQSSPALIESTIRENSEHKCNIVNYGAAVGIIGNKAPSDVLDTVSFWPLTKSALNDAFALPMLALFLFFMFLLAIKKEKNKMSRRAALLIFALYLANIIYGVGFLSDVAKSQLSFFFYKIIGLLSIIVSVAHIRHFFTKKRILLEKLSLEAETKIKDRLRFFISPQGAFILGLLGGIIALTTRSPTFESLRVLALQPGLEFAMLPLIMYYCLILVVPFMILCAVLYHIKAHLEDQSHKKSKSGKHTIEDWYEHHHKQLNLVVNIIVFVVGVILLIF